MKTFKIQDLGCKVNQYESQLMREQFLSFGFTEANGKPADIYVINTCTVTSSADSASRNLIRRALKLNSSAQIIVTGCYVEKDADEIKKICPDAIIVKNGQKNDIIDLIDNCRGERPFAPTCNGISAFAGHNRAFVKIQDGCDNFCSYCKVPLVRGRARDRGQDEIIKEIAKLVNSGFKEVVLCGICLGAYKDFTGLLDKMEAVHGLKRIRLSSVEPAYVTKNLINKISLSEKICRHLHIPLQSGDNKILKAMNRNYTNVQYLKLIDDIRAKMPETAISTDVLVGFPGETEVEFNNTLKVLKAVKPMRIHAFGFSKRKGTKAFLMPNEVDKNEKARRVKLVRGLGQAFAFSYAKNFQNRVVSVLTESARDKKTNMLTGYTDTYIKVLFEGNNSLVNKILNVKIDKVGPDCVIGAVYNGN